MSGFVAATSGVQRIGLEDLRLNRMDFRPSQGLGLFDECIGAIAPGSFETAWWPKGGGFVGDGGIDVGLLEASWWGEYDPAAGAASRYGFVGITRDALGTPVAAVTVKLFSTSGDTLLDSTISGPDGAFLLNTPYYPDAHYMVAHKSGSPDIDGASVNTLIGT